MCLTYLKRGSPEQGTLVIAPHGGYEDIVRKIPDVLRPRGGYAAICLPQLGVYGLGEEEYQGPHPSGLHQRAELVSDEERDGIAQCLDFLGWLEGYLRPKNFEELMETPVRLCVTGDDILTEGHLMRDSQ